MKILIVTEGFFPGEKYGGPPVSVDNFCSLLDGYEHYVVTRDHDLGEDTPYPSIHEGWNDRGNCKVLYLPDRAFDRASFEKVVAELRPDWIYLQSMFQSCVIACLSLARKYGVRVLLAPRGELCAGAFRKKYKKLPYIAALRCLGLLKNVRFQSTSDEETVAIGRLLGAPGARIFQLSNVPSVPGEVRGPVEKRPGTARIVFLARIHPKKNLLGAIRSFAGVEGDVTFDIYGPIEDPGYYDRCQAAIRELPGNIRARYRGAVGHGQVHGVLSGYDAFLFPTLSENYGHVIAEALSVGCPVILSDQTPWNDVHAHGAGWAIPLDRSGEFTEAIRQVVAWDSRPDAAVRAYWDEKNDLPALREGYRAVFEG